ncbi:MAG: RraA family protein [Pseudomonadota bacterium]
MIDSLTAFSQLNACDLADVLPRSQVLDRAIAPLLPTMPRILGPAYTVHCPAGDNLMMHAAIYAAQPGSIIVARSEDGLSAMVGGNVCAMAQQRGIVGLVIDGVVRDLGEIRELGFPVYARGLCPKPAAKKQPGPVTPTVDCGGVDISPGDLVLADEEGVVALPKNEAAQLLQEAQEKADRAAATPLADWAAKHQQVIAKAMGDG